MHQCNFKNAQSGLSPSNWETQSGSLVSHIRRMMSVLFRYNKLTNFPKICKNVGQVHGSCCGRSLTKITCEMIVLDFSH